ncbi:MAG: bleomycin resistance protein [Sphingomonas bacterium]|uniref:VOC family protein n=1 Tax=Sphingomonas bacterium TaxID=1895847 RepID=UPI00260990F0|nr:VOC family protein [Sphingomonas bacterium]MDB5704010.1 bleomycin resistance protein [Sphingomonas bacterium]
MPTIETYRKQAKLLVRWHREGNYSIGGKLRLVERYRHLTDREALDMAMPLALAQEIVAIEAGFPNWAALKAGAGDAVPGRAVADAPVLGGAIPILFVRDVTAAAAFYRDKLGFAVDFLHGKPPFYGAVSRDRAWLHLRFVHQPNFAELARREGSLILATIETGNVKALFEEYEIAGVAFAQGLVRQAWGGLDFHVRDPDGSVISFVQYSQPATRPSRLLPSAQASKAPP